MRGVALEPVHSTRHRTCRARSCPMDAADLTETGPQQAASGPADRSIYPLAKRTHPAQPATAPVRALGGGRALGASPCILRRTRGRLRSHDLTSTNARGPRSGDCVAGPPHRWPSERTRKWALTSGFVVVAGDGFEPSKAEPTVLQTTPMGAVSCGYVRRRMSSPAILRGAAEGGLRRLARQ